MIQFQEYLHEYEGHRELTRITTFVNSLDKDNGARVKCELEEFSIDEKSEYKKLTVSGYYTDEMYDAFNSYEFDKLVISNGDWRDLPISNNSANRVTCLELGTESVEETFLSRFENLEELYVGGKFRKPLSFVNLKSLKILELYYSPSFDILPSFEKLETLKVTGYKDGTFNFREFLKLKNVQLQKPIGLKTMESISKIPNLNYLGVYSAPALIDCSSLAECKRLRYLRLDSCKSLSNIDFLKSLDLLELGFFTGTDIESVSDLLALKNLKSLAVGGGSKFKDGDLSLLLTSFDLEYLRLKGTRHYKPKAIDITNQVSVKTKTHKPFLELGLYV